MPELPEVETVVRGLASLQGRRLHQLEIYDSRVWFESDLKPQALNGLKLLRLTRRGKYLLFYFEKNLLLIQHFRMTGKMLDAHSPSIPKTISAAIGKKGRGLQIRCRFIFDEKEIWFYDTRRFGTLTLVNNEETYFREKKIAPDPFNDPKNAYPRFIEGITESRKPIKAALLDQTIIAGVGNIYADEVLHRERLHPLTPARKIADLQNLWKAILVLLEESIRSGGSTIRNYVDSKGKAGTFALSHHVYGRSGEKCHRCQKSSKISRILVAGRATHFCPSCQIE